MSQWKDITSYSRGGDTTPHWWELCVRGVRLAVGDSHVYMKGSWLLTCLPFFDLHQLAAKSEMDAKTEAVELVVTTLRAAADEVLEAGRQL